MVIVVKMVPVAAVSVFVGTLVLLSVLHGARGSDKLYKGCPPGWLRFRDTCYFFRGGHIDWYTADGECERLGANLAALDDYDHKSFVHSQLHIKCFDREAECPQLADQGECLRNHDYMSHNCRFSCGFCSSLCDNDLALNKQCKEWARSGYCLTVPDKMLTFCRKSCGCDGYNDHFWIDARYERTNGFLFQSRLDGPFCYQLRMRTTRLERQDCSAVGGAGYICQKYPEKLSLPVADPLHKGCPVNAFGYKGKCYLLNHATHTMLEAEDGCQTKNGNLASLPNLEVLEFVTSELLTRHGSAWIGLSRDSTNQYHWESGDAVAFLPWDAGFDGTQTAACVQVEAKKTGAVISPAQCSLKQASVCEIPRAGLPDIALPGDDDSQDSQDSQAAEVVYSDCSEPWQQQGHFCYKLFKDMKSWQDAQTDCQSLSGDLMSVHSPQTQGVLYRFEEHSVWIGLRKESREKAYEWSDGSPLDYTRWDSTVSFDRRGEHCVQAGSGTSGRGWSGAPCKSTLSYVCQVWRGHLPVVTTTGPTTTEIPISPSTTDGERSDTTTALSVSTTAASTAPRVTNAEESSDTTAPRADTPADLNPPTTAPSSSTMEPNPSIAKETSLTAYADGDKRKRMAKETKHHENYQEKSEKSVTSGWPISPEQLVGILLGCTIFVFLFSVAFVYVSRNARRTPGQMASKLVRSLSIRYNPRSAEEDETRRRSSIVDIQSDPSFGTADPYATPILFVDAKAEVVSSARDRDLDFNTGASMGFENHLYNISTA